MLLPLERVIWNELVSSAFEANPIYVRHHLCRGPRVTRPHRQPGIEIHVSHFGKGSFHLLDRILPLQAGHVLLLDGLCPHQVFADTHTGYERTVLCVSTPIVDWLGSQIGQVAPNQGVCEMWFRNAPWQKIQEHLHRIVVEYEKRQPYWEQAVLANLLELTVIIKRQIDTDAENEDQTVVRQCMNVINNCLDAELSVDVLARTLSVSPKYLSRAFARTVGYGISTYVKYKRCDRARQMLLENPYRSVAAIADCCGFKTAAHFSRVFREQYGMAPSAFRNRYARDNRPSNAG